MLAQLRKSHFTLGVEPGKVISQDSDDVKNLNERSCMRAHVKHLVLSPWTQRLPCQVKRRSRNFKKQLTDLLMIADIPLVPPGRGIVSLTMTGVGVPSEASEKVGIFASDSLAPSKSPVLEVACGGGGVLVLETRLLETCQVDPPADDPAKERISTDARICSILRGLESVELRLRRCAVKCCCKSAACVGVVQDVGAIRRREMPCRSSHMTMCMGHVR